MSFSIRSKGIDASRSSLYKLDQDNSPTLNGLIDAWENFPPNFQSGSEREVVFRHDLKNESFFKICAFFLPNTEISHPEIFPKNNNHGCFIVSRFGSLKARFCMEIVAINQKI